MSLSERRCMPRFPFHSSGTLRVGTLEYSGVLIDISLRGALFMADKLPELGLDQQSTLTVYYAGKSAFLVVNGWIVHLHERQVGVKFVQGSKTLEQSLLRLIDLNLGTHRLLKREIPALLR
jgi:PilZ domain